MSEEVAEGPRRVGRGEVERRAFEPRENGERRMIAREKERERGREREKGLLLSRR